MPVRQAFSIELVGREDVGNAVALNSAMFNGARVIGPALAGLAIAAFGVGPAFAINALSFLAVIVGLAPDGRGVASTRWSASSDRPPSRAVIDNLAEGLRYVRRTEVVLLAVVVVGTVATVGMNFNVLIPAFAEGVLQSDASGYGFLMAASGIGSLLAAMRLVFGGRPRPIRLATGAMLLGVASVLLAVDRNFAIALGLMVLIGFGSILMAATGNTTIQLAVPDQLRGRVMSVYTTAFSVSVPLGGLTMGAVASAAGRPVRDRARRRAVAADRRRRPGVGAPALPGDRAGRFGGRGHAAGRCRARHAPAEAGRGAVEGAGLRPLSMTFT